MEIKTINLSELSILEAKIQSLRGYSIFHTSAWGRLLQESYDYKPVYFTVMDQNKPVALVPAMEVNTFITRRRGVSLPFTDYCDLLMDDKIEQRVFLDSIFDQARKLKWNFIQFRTKDSALDNAAPSDSFCVHTLDLSQGEAQLLNGCRGSTRRNIKKALKSGIEISRQTSFESVKAYYRLHCLTRKDHGTPPQPFYFFKNLYKHVISKNLGCIFLAVHNGKTIAGNVYLHFGHKAYYKYGASDRKFQHLRASNLVMWEAIRHYAQNGYEQLCFGRTEPENKGLRQYKKGWGAAEELLKYYRYDCFNKIYKEERKKNLSVSKPLSLLPVPVLKLIGILLYRHAG